MAIGPIKITLADRYENPYPTDVHSPYTAPVSTPVQNTSGPGPWNNFNPVQPSVFDPTEFKGPTKITPAMAAEGWKAGSRWSSLQFQVK